MGGTVPHVGLLTRSDLRIEAISETRFEGRTPLQRASSLHLNIQQHMCLATSCQLSVAAALGVTALPKIFR
jgi:hypothetical protein